MKKQICLFALLLMPCVNKNCQTDQNEITLLKGPYLGQTPPDSKSKIFAPDFISTKEWGELNSVFSNDGKEFYFSRRGIPNTPSTIMVTRMTDNVWTKPEPVSFTTKYNDIDLFITPDGKSMIYCSGRIKNDGNKLLMNNDFWISKREGNKWCQPEIFAKEACSEFEDYFPIVTKSGNLYFNSQRGGPGTNDIFCSKFINGQYTTAERLPEPINTKYREFDAFVSQDENMIIFSSEKPGGFGGADIYISFKKTDGKWSDPKNLGNNINSEKSEYGATITFDGKYLFYTSNRNGTEDIYWVSAKFIEELRPKQ